ncbi:MAG: anaerobic ribonucleoside-triphosphate reductase activating protein [Desulfococcaceae bacterium]
MANRYKVSLQISGEDMLFGGLQKNSFIDYPGKISCVLFCQGCNFRCPYCHNPGLINMEKCPQLYEKDVYDFLISHREFLDGVVISGGEPTLHNDLADLFGKVKEIGYPVKLDTNGSRPDVLRSLIEKGLVDYLAMDIKTDPMLYSSLIMKNCLPENILASIHAIMESGLPYEFRTTCVRPFINEENIRIISYLIRGARLYAIQQFHETGILNPEFFKEKDRVFTDKDLQQFRDIAAEWVQDCIVR